MAVFGAPLQVTDHALKGLRAAVDIIESHQIWMTERQRIGRPAPAVTVGVATGQAVVGNFGSEEHLSYTCIGRHVNLANRLESAAQPDQVLISKSTWLLVEKNFETVQMQSISAKGFKDPMEAYLVIGEKGEIARQTIFQKSTHGFSLWLDPGSISEKERKSTAEYLCNCEATGRLLLGRSNDGP